MSGSSHGGGRGAVPADMTAVVERLRTGLGNAAAYVNDLRAKVKAGMTQEEAAEVTTGLASIADGLDALGTDPTNTTPPTFGAKK